MYPQTLRGHCVLCQHTAVNWNSARRSLLLIIKCLSTGCQNTSDPTIFNITSISGLFLRVFSIFFMKLSQDAVPIFEFDAHSMFRHEYVE